jgi:hypothetical protein
MDYFSIKKSSGIDRLKPDIDQVSSSTGESFPSTYLFMFATATSLSLAYPKWYVIATSLFGQAPLAILCI